MGNAVTMNFAQDGITNASIANEAFSEEQFDADAVMYMALGKVVQRDTANLPQTATEALFTITGGRVLITSLVGEVTTVIQTQANNAKLQANPTASGSSVDICANLDVTAKAVASLFAITGTLADAMVNGLAVKAQLAGIVAQTGTIDLVCSASNTGQVKWTLHYVPLDVGARVTAA